MGTVVVGSAVLFYLCIAFDGECFHGRIWVLMKLVALEDMFKSNSVEDNEKCER